MKVLIFCSADLTVGSGSEIRARLITEGLSQNGVQVFIVSSGIPKNFQSKKITGRVIKRGNDWQDVLDKAARDFQPDIVYGITEAGMDVVAAVARKYRAKLAFDLHGIGVVEILELGAGFGNRINRSLSSLRWLSRMPLADLITVANPTLYPIIKLFNWKARLVVGITDTDHFKPHGPTVKPGKDRSKIQVLYAGNFFKWQGVELFVKAIDIVLKKDLSFEFTIIGSIGRNDKWLLGWKEKFKNASVNFVESVDFLKIADYYRGSDILVIPRPLMLSTYLAIPQKLIDYMSSGRAVLATNLAPHRWALEKAKAGLLCAANQDGLAGGILKLRDSKLRKKLGLNARMVAREKFSHLKQTKKIKKLFSQILV